MSGTFWQSLSNFEKFGLLSGIVGLLSDVIALSIFAVGLFGANSSGTIPPPLKGGEITFIVITGLILFYGWVALAWMAAIRRMNNLSKRTESFGEMAADFVKGSSSKEIKSGATFGVGCFLSPIVIIWLTIVAMTTAPYFELSYSFASIAGLAIAVVVCYLFLGRLVLTCLSLLLPFIYDDFS